MAPPVNQQTNCSASSSASALPANPPRANKRSFRALFTLDETNPESKRKVQSHDPFGGLGGRVQPLTAFSEDAPSWQLNDTVTRNTDDELTDLMKKSFSVASKSLPLPSQVGFSSCVPSLPTPARFDRSVVARGAGSSTPVKEHSSCGDGDVEMEAVDGPATPLAAVTPDRGASSSSYCPPEIKKRETIALSEAFINTSFVKNVSHVRGLVKIGASFELEIVPEVKKTVEGVEETVPAVKETVTILKRLTKSKRESNFSEVYLCEVAGKGKRVLKFYRGEIAPGKSVISTSNQLFRYYLNRTDEELQNHIARVENFEPHLGAIKDIVGDRKILYSREFQKIKDYVKNQPTLSFSLAEYVPNDFSVEFRESAPAWQTLKALFQRCYETGICNDLKWDNVRMTAEIRTPDGKVIPPTVQLIDLLEMDEDEEFEIYIPKHIASFVNKLVEKLEEQEMLYNEEIAQKIEAQLTKYLDPRESGAAAASSSSFSQTESREDSTQQSFGGMAADDMMELDE